MTVYRELARELVTLGVERLFGLVGEDTVAFVTEAARAGVAYHGTRHENIAVGMADGFAWRSGGIGLCTVTRGPGLLNAAMAIRTAARAGRSVLVITGDMPTGGDRTWDFKAIEHGPLAAALGAEYFTAPTADAVIPALHRALAVVAEGRTAVYSVPVDVLHGPPAAFTPPRVVPAAAANGRPAPRPEDVKLAAEILDGARRPLILAGRGAADAATRRVLEQLAEHTGALLGTSLLARELFAGSPYDVGVVGGFSSDPGVAALSQIDCAVVFGASLNPWTTGGGTLLRGVPVVHVDLAAPDLPGRLAIRADALETARLLLTAVRPHEDKPFHGPDALAALRGPLWAGPDESNEAGLDPRAITTTLDALLPAERTIVLDSGRHLTSTGRFVRFLAPRAFRTTADGGAIGMGLGVALGAQAASRWRPTVLFAGDGGLSMTLGDLETAVRHRLPLIVVVMNDAAYGSELIKLEAMGLEPDHALLPRIDFAAAARALGIESATVRTLDDLRLHAFSGRTTPLLLDCHVRPDLSVRRATWSRAAS